MLDRLVCQKLLLYWGVFQALPSLGLLRMVHKENIFSEWQCVCKKADARINKRTARVVQDEQ